MFRMLLSFLKIILYFLLAFFIYTDLKFSGILSSKAKTLGVTKEELIEHKDNIKPVILFLSSRIVNLTMVLAGLEVVSNIIDFSDNIKKYLRIN